MQSEVWRGEGESVSLCQVILMMLTPSDTYKCQVDDDANLSHLAPALEAERASFTRCERDRSGWEARWSRLLLPCRQSCRWDVTIFWWHGFNTNKQRRPRLMLHSGQPSYLDSLCRVFVVELWIALRLGMIGCNAVSGKYHGPTTCRLQGS